MGATRANRFDVEKSIGLFLSVRADIQLFYLLPHLGWIAASPQTGKIAKMNEHFDIFPIFPAYANIGPDGPKWGQEDFFLLIQTLPTFWAERILIFRFFIFWICWAPTLGPAWAQLGPSCLFSLLCLSLICSPHSPCPCHSLTRLSYLCPILDPVYYTGLISRHPPTPARAIPKCVDLDMVHRARHGT